MNPLTALLTLSAALLTGCAAHSLTEQSRRAERPAPAFDEVALTAVPLDSAAVGRTRRAAVEWELGGGR